MTRAVYFDCFAGASGDMIVGALLDLGADFETLKQQLASLKLGGYQVTLGKVTRAGIAASKFEVHLDEGSQPERRLDDICSIINDSNLSEKAKGRSISVFERLADAEAKVHSTTPDKLHFHEVGAVDSIVDIAGAMIGVELLGFERFFASPMRVGCGSIQAAHGSLPVPAPGTAELLRGVPVYSGEREGEFVTPTGAAIVTSLCESFGPLPAMTIEGIGYGAGSHDPEGFPNALRLFAGALSDAPSVSSAAAERIVVVETNIDDMNPQACGFVMERAFELGALDVFILPVQMKKGRPGIQLTVLCEAQSLDAIGELLLAETTTLGVRYYEARRRVLERVVETVETGYGSVKIKVAREAGRTLHFQPEYEDCAKLARAAGVALLEIQSAASAAYREQLTRRQGKK